MANGQRGGSGIGKERKKKGEERLVKCRWWSKHGREGDTSFTKSKRGGGTGGAGQKGKLTKREKLPMRDSGEGGSFEDIRSGVGFEE